MRQYKYNISCSKPCHVAWSGEQNGTILTFEGYKMDNEENALYLVLDGYASIPLADYSLLINQPLSASPTTFRACLMEVSNDGETVFKSNPFTLKVEKSADASADYEVVDERLELVYLKHNALYQESKSYYEDIQRRVEAGEFNGKDGDDGKDGVTPIKGVDYFDGKDGHTPVKGKDYFDGEDGKDYQITPSDYEAIAERTKELVPPYDDTEIRSEINSVNESITELSEAVEGKVGFEDYATSSKGGVLKLGQSVGAYTSGQMYAQTRTVPAYNSMANDHFIGKGTLENVLAERLGGKSLKVLTQEEYNLIDNPSDAIIYVIVG